MKRSFIDLTRISGAVVFVFLFMNYNLSKVNLREREREDTRSKRNNFQDNKTARPILGWAFLFGLTKVGPKLRDYISSKIIN